MKTKSLTTFISSLISSFTLLSPALAETISNTGDLQKSKKALDYIYSPAMFDVMRDEAVKQDKKLGIQSGCNSEYTVKPYGTMILSPIVFSKGKENPDKGAWQNRYQVDRCGESKIYNVSFVAKTSDATPISKLDYPGTTLGNPKLFYDSIGPSSTAALYKSGLQKECKNAEILDTQVTEQPHNVVKDNKSLANVWNEVWTFQVCGKMVEVPITFIPNSDGSGISYEISAK